MTEIQSVAFGEAADGLWGVVWLPESHGSARLAVGRGDTQDVLEVALDAGGPDEAWALRGETVSLEVTPIGQVAHGGMPGGLESTDHLCTVGGQITLGGVSAELTTPGWRGTATAEPDLGTFASIRWLAGWVGSHGGFSLTAMRPRRARGHDADLLAAALIDDPPPPRIEDPRLSTTYAENGGPARIGLELWFEPQEENPPAGTPTHEYPRRASGEVTGRRLEWQAAGFDLDASLVSWRSHSQEGPGVYVLARRR